MNINQYLGRLITPSNEMGSEIDGRMTLGCQRFDEYRNLMKDKNIAMWLKRKMMDTVERCAITYGAEVRTLAEHHKKIAVAHRSGQERSMRNITKKGRMRDEAMRRGTVAIDKRESKHHKRPLGRTPSQNGRR